MEMGHVRGPGGYQFMCKTADDRPILEGGVKRTLGEEISEVCRKYELKDVSFKIFPRIFILFFSDLSKLSQNEFADELLIRTENLLKNEFMYKKVWREDYLFRMVSDVSKEAAKKTFRHVEDILNESE